VDGKATFAGVVTALAWMLLMMSLAGGFGLWTFDLLEFGVVGNGFWIWSFFSWVMSVSGGAFLAAITARKSSRWSGQIHGITTWAGVIVAVSVFMSFGTGRLLRFAEEVSSLNVFWVVFLGNAAALLSAIIVGGLGARLSAGMTSSRDRASRERLSKDVISIDRKAS